MKNRAVLLLGLSIILVLTALNGCKDASLQSSRPMGLELGFDGEGKFEVGSLVANGYRSMAFPAATTTVVVQGADLNSPVTLILVNASPTEQTVQVTAQFSDTNANISKNVEAAKSVANVTSLKSGHHELDMAEMDRVFRGGNFVPAASLSSQKVMADIVGTEKNFNVNAPFPIVPSVCKKVVANPVGGGQTFFYSEKTITDSRLTQFISDLAQNWPGIYVKNRDTFGEELPAGTINGVQFTADVTILVLASGTIDPNQDSYVGFFHPKDLLSKSENSTSNERKMFYLRFEPNYLKLIKSTLAHEFAHLIYGSQKGAINKLNTGLDEAKWETESLAGYAEHVNSFGIPDQNPDLVMKAKEYLLYHFAHPLDGWKQDDADYGKAYLFGTWFAQKYGKNGSLKDLVAFKAVGKAAFEGVSGKTFLDLQSQFAVGLFINDHLGSSIYGIKGINLQGSYGPEGAKVTLTGPAIAEEVTQTTSKPFTLQKFSSLYVNYKPYGKVTFTLPETVRVYELHK